MVKFAVFILFVAVALVSLTIGAGAKSIPEGQAISSNLTSSGDVAYSGAEFPINATAGTDGPNGEGLRESYCSGHGESCQFSFCCCGYKCKSAGGTLICK